MIKQSSNTLSFDTVSLEELDQQTQANICPQCGSQDTDFNMDNELFCSTCSWGEWE